MKKQVFKRKTTHATRLVKKRYPEHAAIIKEVCRHISLTSRRASLSDRMKLRAITDSMLRNAARLEGKA